MNSRFSLFVLAIVLFTAGCGGSGPPLYSVTGTVTYKGKSLPTGSVMFVPDSQDAKAAIAEIDAGGRYQLKAQAGSYKIRVEMIGRLRSQSQGPVDKESANIPVVDWLIPEIYADSETSGLTAVVKEGENNIIDLPLK